MSKNPQWRQKRNTEKPKNKRIWLCAIIAATIILLATACYFGLFPWIEKIKKTNQLVELNIELSNAKKELSKLDQEKTEEKQRHDKIMENYFATKKRNQDVSTIDTTATLKVWQDKIAKYNKQDSLVKAIDKHIENLKKQKNENNNNRPPQ